MPLWTRLREFAGRPTLSRTNADGTRSASGRLRADGGERSEGDGEDESEEAKPEEDETNDGPDVDRSTVEVAEPGDVEPAEPEWEEIDPDDIPEFEIRADQPTGADADDAPAGGGAAGEGATDDRTEDPTAGMPNTARSPGRSRIEEGGTEGYLVAIELCAHLPDDVRLPEQAADLVPAAVEAELEEDVRAFAAAEFDTASPHVETLEFVDVDDEIWLRLRLGVSPDSFADLDPDEIRAHALQRLEGVF